jgi:hypothetical protein
MDWAISTFVLVPLMAMMSAAVAALISTRVATYRAAYQLNGLIVLPIVAILIPQTMLLFFITPRAIWILAFLFLMIDIFLVTTAVRLFDREHLLRGR